jgi:Ni,Fe-hydrogenase I cytochrome b subunit
MAVNKSQRTYVMFLTEIRSYMVLKGKTSDKEKANNKPIAKITTLLELILNFFMIIAPP